MVKTVKSVALECFRAFVVSHPELQKAAGGIVNQIATGDKIIYSQIAIEFAVQYLAEEKVLKK